MTCNENHARAIFLGALEREPRQWAEYLELTCGSDPEVRTRVDELLRAHAAMGNIQGGYGTPQDSSSGGPLPEGPGTVIGPYRLLEKIGEGGFGVVYMADQTQPVRRKVALKIVKPGMDTRQVVARFEAERQALALMDHPNIAQVFDGGTTATGRPYFVMELVRGTPITVFCDENLLSVRQRLELFVTVCHAVQHAHQKGIIHRDLKPSNVMVTLHDDQQVIKVIDFGIAKAVGQQLTEKTLFTNFAQMIGTPPYMSPEQAQMSGLDIDTRSDIYSMGVLLYELLTGTTPFDQERLRTVAFDEIRRIIREEEPPKPSTRLSPLDEAATTASTKRRSDPRKLSQVLRGELDWIVMKCLEKERNRRYETANGLALDLSRYLQNEPVQACPPSLAYRTRVFVRRHRRSLTTAGLLVAIAAIGCIMTVWQAIRAASARETAVKARLALSATRQNAAEERADSIARDLERLNTANSLIESGRIHAGFGEWAKADADLSTAVKIRPDHSSGWLTRGDKYARLGLWDLAAADFQRAYQLQEPTSVSALYLHAILCFYVGDVPGYRKICARMSARFHEPNDPRVCDEMVRACLLVDDPVIPPDELVRLAEGVVNAAWTPIALVGLGTAYYRAGQYEAALDRLVDAKVNAGNPQWDSTWADSVMALAHYRLGRPDLARKDLESASAALGRRLQMRSDNLRSALSQNWWYDAHANLFYREAETLVDGTDPSNDARVWINRGDSLAALGRNLDAIKSFDRAITLDGKLVAGYARRSAIYARLGDWDKLLQDYERLRVLQPDRADVNNTLARELSTCPDPKYHDPARAVALAEKAVALAPDVAAYWNTLGIARYRARDWRGSVKALFRSMQLSQARDVSDWLFLAMVQWRLDQKARAQQLFTHALQRLNKSGDASAEAFRFREEAAALLGQSDATPAKPTTSRIEDPSAYTLLLEIDPEALWLYERRGEACAFLRQWDQAAADLARATKSDPENAWLWYGAAAARLGSHDLDGYRRVRADILSQFANTTVPTVASHLVYICVVLPARCDEAETMLRLAQFGVLGTPANPRVRAAAHYRAGKYQAAIRDLNESAKVFPSRAWDWLFLAMSQHHLGQSDDARQSLKKAEDWIGRANKNRYLGSGLVWISWYESIEVEQLLGEAKALIR